MIAALLTFAVSGSVFAAQSLMAAARADNNRFGTAMRAVTSIALGLTDAIKINPAAVRPVRATAPATPKAAVRRKACTLKV